MYGESGYRGLLVFRGLSEKFQGLRVVEVFQILEDSFLGMSGSVLLGRLRFRCARP